MRKRPVNNLRERKGDWMQTYTGLQFWPLDPRVEEICIEDIAHALSLICRFNGHCQKFYSVAEHSVLVSQNVNPKFALHGLLHDAAEAYCQDITRPIKPFLREYGEIEREIAQTIYFKFGIDSVYGFDEVKRVDNAILADEVRLLMSNKPAKWFLPEPPLYTYIECWSPGKAEIIFLNRFKMLTT